MCVIVGARTGVSGRARGTSQMAMLSMRRTRDYIESARGVRKCQRVGRAFKSNMVTPCLTLPSKMSGTL